MSNNDYLAQMVLINDFIMIDTSTLLDTEWLRLFSERADPIFRAAGKQIIIPPAVRSELLRHYDSEDESKRIKAREAVNILADFKDLFLATGGPLEDDDVINAFADAEILALLTVNRLKQRQLLIANDRDLTRDAYNLNLQLSCQGARICVCHVNRFGELQKCDCVQEFYQERLHERETCKDKRFYKQFSEEHVLNEQSMYTIQANCSMGSSESACGSEEENHISSVSGFNENERSAESAIDDTNSDWKWLLAFGGGALSGYAVGKYGNIILGLLKTAVCL